MDIGDRVRFVSPVDMQSWIVPDGTFGTITGFKGVYVVVQTEAINILDIEAEVVAKPADIEVVQQEGT